MDPKDKELLQKVLEVSEENRRMIHKLYSSWWWGRIGKAVYWIVIVGVAFGAFYFLQPYVDRLQEVVGGARNGIDAVQRVSQVMVGN